VGCSFDPNTYSVSGVGTVAPEGYFALNSSGGIYYYSPGTGYVKFPGTASGIAGVIGGFFALKYPASAGGEGLSYFDYGSANFTSESGSGVRVATGAGSGGVGTELYVLNSGNAITEYASQLPLRNSLNFAASQISQNFWRRLVAFLLLNEHMST
jgi:hypothetical protein